MTDAWELLAGLSPTERQLLLARLLAEKASRDPSPFPLSHEQRGLWFLSRMDPDSPAYNVSHASRIRSPLDPRAFRTAMQALTDRHASLRTTFEERDGQLLQHVHEQQMVHLEEIDASSWSEDALRDRLEAETHRPFDPRRGPLMRTYLFRRAADDHVFLMSAHHIVGDFWSLVVLVDEMGQLYPAAKNGTPIQLPVATASYRDYVRWQTDLLAGPDGERLRSYWERQLAGVPVLELPTDRPRPPRLTSRGGNVPCRLGADLTRRLKALAADEGATLYTVLLTALQTLLGRYADQTDVVVGTPFASRSRPEFESLVGYFINMLPLRADLSENPTFRTLLRQVGTTVRDALQHRDYPFPLLVERLGLKRDPSRTPLVQVTFALERSHKPSEPGAGRYLEPGAHAVRTVADLRTEPYPLERRTSQTDLELILEESSGTLAGMLHYNADLFDAATMERMARHFQRMLVGIVADPDSRLSELPWLTEPERRQVVEEWNATRVEFPGDGCLHHFVERQAARTPDAVAVRATGRSLTYRELDAQADRLAERLHGLGVGPGAFVALCLERSPEMVVAMLAALKAGGAFVPLDPASPPARLRSILTELRPTAIVRSEGGSLRIQGEEVPHRNEAPARRPTSADLAYVIHTSGSSGRPKGVMVDHRAICNTVQWHLQALPTRPDDRVLLLMPYFFDAAITVVFPTLAAGATLVLADPGEERDPTRLLDRIAAEGVTILPNSPGLLRLLLDGPIREKGRSLRWICSGGEAMSPELAARLFELLDVELYNRYGPTEIACDATWWPCRRGDDRPTVPIGRPIANARVYVLDRHRQPLPVGVPGELYVGGAGVARGYLNDPVQTAARFLPDPFHAAPGACMYRTGDRARWLPDGTLEFLGRIDHQVKVRGYRIEPGEIEEALRAAPEVREAAVVAVPDPSGGSRLVAYVVPQDADRPPLAEALRQHLRERLPEYMVPSAFVRLAVLPRTPTDKVDRRALIERTDGASRADRPSRAHIPPATLLEEFLAGLWRELLQVEAVGVEEQFFELGGNSIQAAIFVNRLQEKLGRPISTVVAFESPTIAGLARYLRENYPDEVAHVFGPESVKAERGASSDIGLGISGFPLVVPLQPNGSRPPCFMVHPPGGIVVCYHPLARHLGGDRPFYGIRSRGLHGEADLPDRLEDMAADYVTAIREVQPEGPYHLGGWSMGGLIAFEMAQQLLAAGQAVDLLALLDTTIPTGAANRSYAEEIDLGGREYGLDISLEELDRLGPEEQLPYLWEHVQRLGLVEPDMPGSVVRQILDDLKRLFHAHVRMANDYAVRPYPGRITLFRPLESVVPVATAPDRNWGKVASAVEVHFVPGHHHTIVKEPHVEVLARQFRACLERVGD